MKKMKAVALVCTLMVLNGMTALAQDEARLGKSHYCFEMALMFLQHRTFETDDGGGYVGLTGYGHLGNNWYLGGEIGAGFGMGAIFSDGSTFTPLQLNAKKALALSPSWVVALGGGLSYSRVEFSHNSLFTSNDFEVADWVFGGQVLCDFLFKAGRVPLGLKLMYQLTADLPEVAAEISPDEGWDYSNFRIGLQIGFMIVD
jgi:hypothetical protein